MRRNDKISLSADRDLKERDAMCFTGFHMHGSHVNEIVGSNVCAVHGVFAI